jgi:hypothetical protein
LSTPQLIVPSRLAEGKPNRQKVANPFRNPFAEMLRRRRPHQKKYYGKVWKSNGQSPIPMAPGRKAGKPHGVFIDEMVTLRKVILLCWRCQPRFFYKRANYYKDAVFSHTTGKCDACKEFEPRAQAYYPEERLAEPGGMLRPGQVLTPR